MMAIPKVFYDYNPFHVELDREAKKTIIDCKKSIRMDLEGKMSKLHIDAIEYISSSRERIYNYINERETKIMEMVKESYDSHEKEIVLMVEKNRKTQINQTKNKIRQLSQKFTENQNIIFEEALQKQNSHQTKAINMLNMVLNDTERIIKENSSAILCKTEKIIEETTMATLDLFKTTNLNDLVLSAVEKIVNSRVLHVHQHEYLIKEQPIRACCGPGKMSMEVHQRQEHGRCFGNNINKTIVFEMCSTLDRKLQSACHSIAAEWQKTAKKKQESLECHAEFYRKKHTENEELIKDLRSKLIDADRKHAELIKEKDMEIRSILRDDSFKAKKKKEDDDCRRREAEEMERLERQRVEIDSFHKQIMSLDCSSHKYW